jgi:hypothetical protein
MILRCPLSAIETRWFESTSGQVWERIRRLFQRLELHADVEDFASVKPTSSAYWAIAAALRGVSIIQLICRLSALWDRI